MSQRPQELAQAFVAALADVVGARLSAVASSGEGETPSASQWLVTLGQSDGGAPEFVLALDAGGVEAVASALGTAADEAAHEALLKDLVVEASAEWSGRQPEAPPPLAVRQVTLAKRPPAGTPLVSASVAVIGVSAAMSVACYAAGPSRPEAAGAARQESRTAVTPAVELSNANPRNELQQARLDAILEIDLPVVVRFGRTEMALRAVTRLAPGAVIELGRSPDDPVELLVSDRVVARGEVVVVGGNYGIRILDVVSPSERVRSLEG